MKKARSFTEYFCILWCGPYYYNETNDEYFHERTLPHKKDKNTYLKMPVFSMAYLRQLFIDQCYALDVLNQSNDEYNLLSAPRFLICDELNNKSEALHYIGQAHWFCEDHGLESQFWAFAKEYCNPFMKTWCDMHAFPYLNEIDLETDDSPNAE